jgi:hypothetical protein
MPHVADTGITGAFDLPFKEQVDFFRRKLNLPTARWDDIKKSAHDRAFVVAGAMKADLLDDLRRAVEDNIKAGKSVDDFRRDFPDIVARRGWHGWTGEGTAKGEAWRTRVIYETNLRTSYAAGRHAQLKDPGLLERRPFWQYVHSGHEHYRPEHKAWGDSGLTLRHDDPFWQTHYPPNGWGCGCSVRAVSAPADGAATAPPAGWDTPSPKTGMPPGIDKGWDYAPGANATTPLLDLVGQKLLNLDAGIGAALWEALEPATAIEQNLALKNMVDHVAATLMPQGKAVLVGGVSVGILQAFSKETGKKILSADIWLRDAELAHSLRDAKTSRGAALPVQTWRSTPSLLKTADVYYDRHNDALVYVFPTEHGKVAMRVNYTGKFTDASGRKRRNLGNFIKTGGAVSPGDIAEPQYVLLGRGGGGGI